MKWPKTKGIVYDFGHCDFKSGWSSLGSNLITNNVNAVSLPCTHQAMSFSAFKMGGQCHPRLCLGWHCSPISKASNGIARCVLGRLTAFYQCSKLKSELFQSCNTCTMWRYWLELLDNVCTRWFFV